MAPGTVRVRPAGRADRDAWFDMRCRLWPGSGGDHAREIDQWLIVPAPDSAVFVAADGDGKLCGFLEAGTRAYAEGCSTSPVGYVEGWWVDEAMRRRGVGTALLRAAEDWARRQGLAEMASDAALDNVASHVAHRALGYAECDRIVCFRKSL